MDQEKKALAIVQLARRLAATAEGLTLDEIAGEMGVSRRTAERLRDSVRVIFPRMEEMADGRGLRFRIPGGLDGFIQTPRPEELAELQAAVRAHEQAGGHERAALLAALGDRIAAAIRPGAKSRIDTDLDALIRAEALTMQAGPRPMASGEILSRLREALVAVRICAFDYAGAGSPDARRRAVEPYGLLYGRAYYLVGREVGKAGPVLWRLDRIADLELGDAFDGPPADFDLTVYAARSFGAFQEPPSEVALRFPPPAAADARRFLFHPGQNMEEEADGSVLVRFTAGGLLEIARHLFTWGDGVEILAPEGLKRLMVAELERALAHHRGG